MWPRLAIVTVIGLAGCHAPLPARPTTGAILGLVRDRATGERIAMAELHLRADGQLARGATARSDQDGAYDFDRLAPGRYGLNVHYAGDVVEIANVIVVAGRATPVDVAFELGRVDPLHVDFGDPSDGAIEHYRPPGADPRTGLIEGTVSDAATRERVPGAVVTAALGVEVTNNHQVITDSQGRFVFPALAPGTYSVSAYYTVARRGHIEVQRNGLDVQGGQAVVVPLWVELEN